jgi:hypothetical protein
MDVAILQRKYGRWLCIFVAYHYYNGDPGIYNPLKDVTFQCPGDTVVLTMGQPFTKNVQWYNNGKPIDGATSPKFIVTEKGSYTACGSPAVCPSFTDCEGIPVNFTFEKAEATITERNDTLFASGAKNYSGTITVSLFQEHDKVI